MMTGSGPLSAGELGGGLGKAEREAAQERIVRHLIHMYSSKDLDRAIVRKWNKPIRYYYGAFPREADRAWFEATMRYFAELTGPTVERSEEVREDVDLWLIFTNDFKTQMSAGVLRRTFQEEGESDAAFEARVASVPATGAGMRKMGTVDDTVGSYVAVINAAAVPEADIPGLVMKEIFRAFTFSDGSDGSDAIRPSVANTELLPRPDRLPSIDEAFLRALYSEDIRHGMPLREAVPRIALHIYRDLYPEER